MTKLEQRIKKHEGLRLAYYVDTKGKPTIGYGHNLLVPIPKEAAEIILQADLKQAAVEAEQMLPKEAWDNLNEARRGVLTEMVFNLGAAGVWKFHNLFVALRRGDYSLAAIEMTNSKWAQQVGKRAQTLAEIMATGRDDGA